MRRVADFLDSVARVAVAGEHLSVEDDAAALFPREIELHMIILVNEAVAVPRAALKPIFSDVSTRFCIPAFSVPILGQDPDARHPVIARLGKPPGKSAAAAGFFV